MPATTPEQSKGKRRAGLGLRLGKVSSRRRKSLFSHGDAFVIQEIYPAMLSLPSLLACLLRGACSGDSEVDKNWAISASHSAPIAWCMKLTCSPVYPRHSSVLHILAEQNALQALFTKRELRRRRRHLAGRKVCRPRGPSLPPAFSPGYKLYATKRRGRKESGVGNLAACA